MPPISSWSSRLVLALLALHLASACDPNPPPPPPPPADTTPPSTRATPQGGTFKEDVTVTLLCEDSTGSGCDATYYTTDGSTPSASSPRYSAPVVLTQNTTLKFLSTDKEGNAESAQSLTFVVDRAAPTTTATPAGGTYRTRQNIILACADTGGSECADTYYTLDGTTPDTGSTRYTGPISLSANTTLSFFSVDQAGNAEAARTETYVIDLDLTAPVTTVDPAGGLYTSERSVTLACADDTAGIGCEGTYYTLDGSTPDTGSTRYTGPISLTANTTLKFFSVDQAGNAESVRTETYTIATPANVSAQIATIRSRANGAISDFIDYALVTHMKPATGSSDPAGFFLQSEKNGPALFVAVDPTTLSPEPKVGDRVGLRATEKATVGGLVRVTKLDTFTVHASGESVDFLINDVSNVDIVASVNDYESELISITGTVATTFASAGAGHVSANLVTMGVPTSTNNLKLRMTTTVQDTSDVTQGCSVTVGTPLWRFNAQAQSSAWVAKDLTVLSCPAPKVASAVATSSTGVTLNFDRKLDPASVLTDGSQFTFDNGLVASAATVTDRQVQLITSTQVEGTAYTVTVASSVRDTRGSGIETTANSATFTGFIPPATLLLNEVNPNLSSGRDLIELLVVKGGSVDRMTVLENTTVLATLPNVMVATGDIIVVHLNPEKTAGKDAPASETTGKDQHASADYGNNYDTAWDFHGGTTGLTYSHRVLYVRDPANKFQDAVPVVRPTVSSPPSAFPGMLQDIQAEGLWLPAECGGELCTYTSTPSAVEVSADFDGLTADRTTSMHRLSGGVDTNQASDWSTSGSASFGLPNP